MLLWVYGYGCQYPKLRGLCYFASFSQHELVQNDTDAFLAIKASLHNDIYHGDLLWHRKVFYYTLYILIFGLWT